MDYCAPLLLFFPHPTIILSMLRTAGSMYDIGPSFKKFSFFFFHPRRLFLGFPEEKTAFWMYLTFSDKSNGNSLTFPRCDTASWRQYHHEGGTEAPCMLIHLVPSPSETWFWGYECGRVFPAGVGRDSPSRDATNWSSSRFTPVD